MVCMTPRLTLSSNLRTTLIWRGSSRELAMCLAQSGPDGHPIHADIAIMGLGTSAFYGDSELGDVSLTS